MGRECCSSGRAAEVAAPRAGDGCGAGQGGGSCPGAGAVAAVSVHAGNPPRQPTARREEKPQEAPLAALVVAPLASIMASALPAVQGAVQGAGDAVTLLVATALPPLLRRLDGKQQRREEGEGDAGDAGKRARRLLPTLSAKDITTFRALARAGGEVGSGILSMGGLVAVAAVSKMSPCGPGCCDGNRLERAANVLTSLPYVAVGLRAAKARRTREGRAWGYSMAGVGAASMFFHATSGELKHLGRKLDYWAIACSSALLTRALRPGGGVPRRLTAASLAATPFRPFPVSTLNTLAMELEFLRRAAVNGRKGGQSEGLRAQQLMHSACALGAMAFFSLEEVFPRAPLLHSTWHLLSSVSCATTNALLEDVERDMGLAPPVGADAAAAGAGAACGAEGKAATTQQRASLEMYVTPLEA